MKGRVIRNTGSWYTVQTTGDGRLIDCKIKGAFRLRGIRSTNPVAVGDHVTLEPCGDNTAFITDIDDRKNYIIRKASNLSKQSHILAANIDRVLLVITVNYPVTTTIFIDRFLATAEAYRVPLTLVFNKIDRYSPADNATMEALMTLYAAINYPCLKICAATGEGMEHLTAVLHNNVTLLAGHSGVGKSTIINRLIPNARIKTAELSQYHNKGTHTTTFSEMFALPTGGFLIDTPGIKGFGTLNMQEHELSHYFREMFALAPNCKFDNCTHRHEPGCAVLLALQQGRIADSRYKSYLSILNDRNDGKYRQPY